MMSSPLPMLLLALMALLTALAAPPVSHDDYPEVVTSEVIAPQKRAALVLDRLLVALQRALHEGEGPRHERPDRDGGPRAAPLRVAHIDDSDMMVLSGEGAGGAGDEEAGYHKPQRGHEYELRVAPLPIAAVEDDTVKPLHNYESSLQRRGQGGGRGRVLRCYFNAVTCF